jgi:predicted Zn-dependent protease
MKGILCFLLGCMALAVTARTQEKQEQLNAQQKLEKTCASIKSGEIKEPPSQLADTCQTLEDDQAAKKEAAKENLEFAAGKYCGAPWVPDSSEATSVNRLLPKLRTTFKREYPGRSVLFLPVKSPVINSWTVIADSKKSLVCMPTGIIDFLSNDGELAFVMGHEIGHAVDQACMRTKKDKAEQRVCEARADAVGFDLLVKSGFSPYDAAAAFGKMEMYSGDTKTGLGAKLLALGNSHPMTPERIEHMHSMLTQYNAVLNGPLAH